ncbi:MAG: RluA family pseudouridine synthase [Acidobacteriota bacterium]
MQLLVDADSSGRLDTLLARSFPEHSRSFLARLIDEGHVLIDGAPATKRSQTIAPGQRITVTVPEPETSPIASQNIALTVLYQDAAIAVIDKPAGMVVHPAAGHRDGTLVNALLFHMPDLSGVGGEIRPGIVHRLDKDTSGLMVVAKTDAAHRNLSANWGTEKIQKHYLAIVYGVAKPAAGTIDRPVGRHPKDRVRMGIVAGGRRAVTIYRTLEEFRGVSLVACELKTGRTHQIRVHMQAIGHPIVGDAMYSGPQWRGIPDKRIQKTLAAMQRQALHASRLMFPHPTTGDSMSFQSELPQDMATMIEALRG